MIDEYQQILDILSRSRKVLVTTHVRPDGDALGTAAAMVMALRQRQISSEVALLSHLPRKYAFIFEENEIPYFDVEAGWPDPSPLDRFDCLLVVDTGTWSQLPGLQDRVRNWNAPKLVLDHHLTQEDWADVKLVKTDSAAAGEIAAELLQRWKIEMDSSIATALFLAIVADSGWFQFSNTRPRTLRLAADLMEAGVDTDRMHQLLYQNERPERVALQARALQSLQLLAGGRLAVICVRQEDFEQTGAGVPDTENLINYPLQIQSVQVSMLMVEPRDLEPVRVSLRSKGQVDVAAFAQQFGGGGHARAAGLKLELGLQEAQDRVVAAMLQQIGAPQ